MSDDQSCNAQRYLRWFTEYPSTHVYAGRTVEVVPATWDGLMAILESYYPESIFIGESGDPGAHIIALTRAIDRLASFIEGQIPGSQVYRASGLVVT